MTTDSTTGNLSRAGRKALRRLLRDASSLHAGPALDQNRARAVWRRALTKVPQAEQPEFTRTFLAIIEDAVDQGQQGVQQYLSSLPVELDFAGVTDGTECAFREMLALWREIVTG